MRDYVPEFSAPALRWVRFFGLVLALAALGWLLNRLSGVFTPIVIGLALAYTLNPLINWMERRGFNRLAAVSVVFVTVIGGLLAVLTVLTYLGVVQLIALFERAPLYIANAQNWLQTNYPDLMARMGDRQQLTAWASEHGKSAAAALTAWAAIVIGGATYWLVLGVLVPMYTFFFLWKFNAIVRIARDHLPGAYRPTLVRIFGTIDRSMAEFFRGRVIICAIYGAIIGLGWLAVGTPYSLPLGLLAAATNLVPGLSIVVLPPALLVSYLDAMHAGTSWFWPIVYTMAVYMAAQTIESFVLAPYVTGQTSGLHPVTTVIVLFIGAELAGLLGILLAIPVASTLKTLAAEYLMPEVRRLASEPPGSASAPPSNPGG